MFFISIFVQFLFFSLFFFLKFEQNIINNKLELECVQVIYNFERNDNMFRWIISIADSRPFHISHFNHPNKIRYTCSTISFAFFFDTFAKLDFSFVN